MSLLKIAQFGLGPIGIESLKLAAAHRGFALVGGVDHDPAKAGRSLAAVAGVATPDSCRVFASLEELLAAERPDVILHTASSSAVRTFEQMRPALERGISVASTCEELIFPQWKNPTETAVIDDLCRASGARVVGTGVNPGFVMDVLPVVLSGVCRQVDLVYVERVVDASTRRQPLQAKIGSGRPPAEFRADFAAGRAGHAGFPQSVALLAHGLGWTLDRIEEHCEPVVADAPVRTPFFDVAAGRTRGLHQRAIGLVQGEARITLDLTMALAERNPHDTVVLRGRPDLHLTLHGGVAGDDATVAALINVVPRLLAAPAGVRLMTELPAPAWSNPNRD